MAVRGVYVVWRRPAEVESDDMHRGDVNAITNGQSVLYQVLISMNV